MGCQSVNWSSETGDKMSTKGAPAYQGIMAWTSHRSEFPHKRYGERFLSSIPHVLLMGREPRSPLEAWCTNLPDGERNTHGEYLETLRKKQAELRSIAQENIKRNLGKARVHRNQNRRESDLEEGDEVMLRKGQVRDSLTPRFVCRTRSCERSDQT